MKLPHLHYMIWLLISAIFFAIGEFLSKKFATEPKINTIFTILFVYSIGTLAWLPAIMQKNQLSIVGVIWSVLSLLITVLIGIIIFHEKIGIMGLIGIITAIISIIFLTFEH